MSKAQVIAKYGSIETWDTSQVTNMKKVFQFKKNINPTWLLEFISRFQGCLHGPAVIFWILVGTKMFWQITITWLRTVLNLLRGGFFTNVLHLRTLIVSLMSCTSAPYWNDQDSADTLSYRMCEQGIGIDDDTCVISRTSQHTVFETSSNTDKRMKIMLIEPADLDYETNSEWVLEWSKGIFII